MRGQILAVSALFLIVFQMSLINAVDYGQNISTEDKATFDKILEPVMKIYNLIKYIASTIAVLVLLFAGVNYIVSGSDPKKRESAKSMAMYVIIGLVIIWAAPLVVQFVIG